MTVIAGVTTNIPFLVNVLDDEDVIAGRLDTTLLERKQEQLARRHPPDHVFAIAALARLWEITPPDDQPSDPFDAATAWRLGEPAWATWRMRCGDTVADVHVRGSRHAAEVRVAEGDVVGASIRWEGPPEAATVIVDGLLHNVTVNVDGDLAWISSSELGTWAVHEEDQLAAARHEDAAGGGTLTSPMPGTVTVVNVSAGESVVAGQTLLVVEAMKMEHPITALVDGIVEAVHVQAGQAVGMDAPLAVVAVPES